MQASPTINNLIRETSLINIQLTSFMDDLAIFFHNQEDIICGTHLIGSFNSIVGIRANIKKSAYIAINSYGNEPIPIGNSSITHATPRTKHRLLGGFLSQTLGTRESLCYAKTEVKAFVIFLRINRSALLA
jgi:hypothetical protein